MYECFHCGSRSVIWGNDYTFEEMGYIGTGIVHVCYCENCGAEIIYSIRDDEDDEEEE